MPATTYLGEEGIEAQHKLLVTFEELLDALDDPGSVDPATQHAPVVRPAAMQDCSTRLRSHSSEIACSAPVMPIHAHEAANHDFQSWHSAFARPPPLCLELLHDLQECVIHLLVVLETHFDLAQVG